MLNNPLKYSDPTGHAGIAIHDSNDGPAVAMSYETLANIQEDYYNLGVSWTNLPYDVRTAFEAQGATGYMDFHGNATSQNGTIRDPAVIGASAFGVGRLALRLPGVLMGACADGDCKNEAESASQTVDSTVSLYRAVRPEELNDLLRFGDYGLSPSGGGKYFALTEQGAREFAQSPLNADVNMIVTKIQVPLSFVQKFGYLFHDPGTYGAKDSVHFADEVLPYLYKIMGGLPQIILD